MNSPVPADTAQATVAEIEPSELVNIEKKLTVTTIVTLGNAVELVAGVAEKILGGEVASSFAGAVLNKEMVFQLAGSVFQKKINEQLGV